MYTRVCNVRAVACHGEWEKRGCLPLLFLGGPGVPVQPYVHLWPHPTAGFLIVLSLTLFVVNCETLQPRPQVSYLVATYLCWAAGALMLWTGEGGAGGRGGASVGQGAEPRRELEAGPGAAQGRTRGASASRGGVGPRAGLGVQRPTSHLRPRPAGALSYLNHLRIRRKGTSLKARRVSHRRWVLRQNTPRRISQQQSDADQEHTVGLPNTLNPSSLSKQSHPSFSGQ